MPGAQSVRAQSGAVDNKGYYLDRAHGKAGQRPHARCGFFTDPSAGPRSLIGGHSAVKREAGETGAYPQLSRMLPWLLMVEREIVPVVEGRSLKTQNAGRRPRHWMRSPEANANFNAEFVQGPS